MMGLGLSLALGLSSQGGGAPAFVGPLDAYTSNLAGAWSVARRLLTDYTGPLIRVRRSSDDAEQDVGFDGVGALDTAALTTFVGSDSAFVTKVYDQSGSGYDAVQATALAQPQIVNAGTVNTLSGKPTMVFNGSTSFLNVSPALQTTAVRSFSCAMKSTGATWNMFGAPIGSASDSAARLALVQSGSTNWYVGDSAPLAIRRNGVSLSSPFDSNPINIPTIFGVDCNPTGVDTPVTIGAQEAYFFLACHLSEIVAWGTVADRTGFESNEKTFFGI